MRRYLSTIIVLLALLAVGGLILYSNYTSELPRPLFGYPLTPLSSNPTEAQTQALILVVGGGVLVGAVVGTGAALAIAAGRYIAFERSRPAAAAVPATAKAEPRTGEPAQVPLSDQRSLAIFWVTVILLFGAFMLIRNWGTEFGYFPMAELAMIELFRLPGQHINGLPAFVAGPGDMLTAMHLLIAVLGMAMVGTAVTGAVLAFGTVRIAHTLKVADRMPRTRLDRMLAPLLYLGKPPAEVMGAAAPARPRPLVERILLGLDAVLIVIILVAVAAWAIPTLSRPAATAAGGGGAGASAGTGNPLEAELAALPAGNAEAGQAVFEPGGAGACAACHSLEPDVRIVGPSLAGAATRAATRRPDYSAELYLYESVTSPNAYVADTFQPDLMPKNFKEKLTPQQLADLIAFLLTTQ